MFIFFFKQERCKDEKLQSKYACTDQPSAPGCHTDGAINRCMGSVSATSGPDTELQVPDEILQNFGMKTSFSKDVPKLPILSVDEHKHSPARRRYSKFVHYVQNYYRHRTDVIVCWLPKFHGFNLAPLFHYTKGRGKFC